MIKELTTKYKISNWQIAAFIGKHENTVMRMLRDEPTLEAHEKRELLLACRSIVKERKEEYGLAEEMIIEELEALDHEILGDVLQ